MTRVVLQNLSKCFREAKRERVRALDEVNLTVEAGELLSVVGPTGCGKTTLLRIIAGLERPGAGEILFDGWNVSDTPPKDRDVAMVFQNHALFPHLTAYENIAFGLRLRGCSRAEAAARVSEAAEMLGLTDCLNRRPAGLSGGQRQRVALGRALVRRPKVFLLDEPLSDLDAPLRAQMRREVARIHRQLAATMIFVTHDQVEALALGDRVAVMRLGRFEQVAAPFELQARPANLFVAGFLGVPRMNFFQGTLEARPPALFFRERTGSGTAPVRSFEVRVDEPASGRLECWSGKPVVMGLRPEHIRECHGMEGSPRDQTVEAVLREAERTGSDILAYCDSSGHSFAVRLFQDRRLGAGQRLRLLFIMAYAHFFDPETERTLP